MQDNSEELETPMNRRAFLDVVSKTVITTAAVCLLPMSQVAAMAGSGHPSSGCHPSSGDHPYIDHPTHPVDPDDNPYVSYGPV